MPKHNNSLVSRDLIKDLLTMLFRVPANFAPVDHFYSQTGINCRRWAKLVRGELPITLDELEKVCHYFSIEFRATNFERQLKFFE